MTEYSSREEAIDNFANFYPDMDNMIRDVFEQIACILVEYHELGITEIDYWDMRLRSSCVEYWAIDFNPETVVYVFALNIDYDYDVMSFPISYLYDFDWIKDYKQNLNNILERKGMLKKAVQTVRANNTYSALGLLT